MLPSAKHRRFERVPEREDFTHDWNEEYPDPNQKRWLPFKMPQEREKVDFVQGLKVVSGAGDPKCRHGTAIYVYTCNSSMDDSAFYSSDGEFMIVPQETDFI